MQRIYNAFKHVDRSQFVPKSSKHLARLDMPLPIGFDQTISQPSTVKRMLHWLDPQPGNTVLDVGSGSGWTSALLSFLVGSEGKVFAVERIPELLEFGTNNCKKLHIDNIDFHPASATYGLPDYAPYDRILVSAAADSLPHELIDQLKPGGTLVIPIKNDIKIIRKQADGSIESRTESGYAFVPLLPPK